MNEAAGDRPLYGDTTVDINGDGNPVRIAGDTSVVQSAFTRKKMLPFDFPVGVPRIWPYIAFVDINSDGKLDCLFSNAERYSLHLFKDMQEGWSIKVIEGVRGKEGGLGPVIPPFVRADGTNNGAWFHSAALWLQNEDTWRLPDGVFKLTFAEMLAPPAPLSPRGRGAGGEGAAAPTKPEPTKPEPTSVLKHKPKRRIPRWRFGLVSVPPRSTSPPIIPSACPDMGAKDGVARGRTKNLCQGCRHRWR